MMTEEKNNGYAQPMPDMSEVHERGDYYHYDESIESGGTRPIDIILMTGQPSSGNSNNGNGDD